MLTKTNHTSLLFSEFNLPEQDLSKLSFCGSNSEKVQQWLESLPITRITETSILLYKALPEICRLKIAPDKRIDMLEVVYPKVHQCIEGLMLELLRQPLILPTQMMKMAVVAQALQRHLNDAYMVAFKHLLPTKKSTLPQQRLALCLYRAISGMGLLLLRSYQLYTPQPTDIWRKLHALYLLAIEKQWEKIAVKDVLLKNRQSMTVNSAYLRNLLLACSAPHRLRQVDIAYIFQAFEQCSSMVQLQLARRDNRQSLYWVSLRSDRGPFYRDRLRGEPDDNTYAIHLEPLVHALESENKTEGSTRHKINLTVPHKNALVTHLLHSWQNANTRLSERLASNDQLEICVGLTAIHNQLLDGDSFVSLFDGVQQPLSYSTGPSETLNVSWGSKNKPIENTATVKNNSVFLTARATNSSVSGYCLIWDDNISDKIRVGELLGIRNTVDNGWQIGIICWAQRFKEKVYTGIHLLSKKANAYAASTVLPDGNNSACFRSLVLVDSNLTETNTIIVPSIPFGIDQTVRLQRYKHQSRIRLVNLLLASTSISQFSYRPLDLEPTA